MDGFIKVKRKSRKKRLIAEYDESSPIFFEKLIKNVDRILDEFSDDPQFSATVNCFVNAAALLDCEPTIQNVICYGLGSISNSKNSLYQFCLIYKFAQLKGYKLSCYDPVFTATDIRLLESKKCILLSDNDSDVITVNFPTLFFLPHCPRFILNNILRANWGIRLTNCLIFGDDILEIVNKTPARLLKQESPFIEESQHFVDVVPLENRFKYNDIFNDFAIHVFPIQKLNSVDSQTWERDEILNSQNITC